MASWNRIQSGFSADDETINFGTRLIAENNGSLYEAHTVAMIASTEKVDQQPNVVACFYHGRLCAAIDKSLTIFNEICDEILCSINFPSTIVCYCMSKDGFFLFVVLTNRILYCLHLSDGKIIFTKTISDNEDNIIQIFLKEEDEETFIILITTAGAIYKFSQFYPKALQSAFIDDDKADIAKHVKNIECSRLYEGFTSPEFSCAAVNIISEELLITMVGTNSVFTWPNKEYNNFHNVFSFGYKKIKPLYGSNKMLCLRTDHKLTIICPNTLLGLKICDSPVLDFTIIQHDATNCEILFLTSSKQNRSVYTLCLISFPEFEQKLEINVPNTAYLLENVHACNYIFYLEGITAENDIISTFRVKAITESVPEMRLARLLKKKQFDTAEDFAERLGLSVEPIYCSKAALIVEQLNPWSKTPDSINVDTLISILDKIQSVQYVTECCSKALISDYTQMKQIYLYAQQRIIQDMKEEKSTVQFNSQLSLINDTLYRLETFRIIQDNETDMLLKDKAVLKKWIRFSQANLLEECITYLSMGQLKPATLIWTRHYRKIVKHVTTQSIRDILGILPDDMAPSCLWPWLIHFIPTLLSSLPDKMDEIISWGVKKLKCLEIFHRTAWPEIGIDFATQFLKLLKFENNQSVYFYQEYSCQNSALKQLMILLQALSDIKQLKTVYSLRVPLDMYVGSPREAIYLLLDKIHLDEISNFVNTFLKDYTLSNNLQTDAVLCAYIQKTTKNSSGWWIDEEVLWEKRVIILINLIHNIENRLEQTLAVLKKVPVPWSSAVTTLAETSSSLDHSLCFKIKIERDYVPIKLVLKKYGYSTIGVNNRLISRVIKEDRDCMIEDIDVLTRNDRQFKRDAFCRCINARLNEGNLQKAMNILHHLESDTVDVLYCYEGIVNYVVAAFSFRNASTSLAYHMEMLDCIEFKIYNLSQQPNACASYCDRIISAIKDLKSLYILKRDYKIDVSMKTYRTQKSLVLRNCITELLSNMKESDLSIIHETAIKIAELLGLEKSYATLTLLEKIENMNALLQLVNNNVEDLSMKTEEFKNIYKICLSALQHAVIDTSIVKILKTLSILMLNTCQDGDLQSALTLYNCISVCPSSSNKHNCDARQEIVPLSNWKLYTIYKDQAITLDQKLLSFFKDAISLNIFYSNQTDNYKITHSKEHMNQVLNNFLENSITIQLQHNDYSLLQIFKMFYFTYHSTFTKNEIVMQKLKSIMYQFSINLLKKLCTGRSFDLHLGLSCLFMLPEQEACTWLSTTSTLYQTDYIRHSTISTLGYEHSRLRNDQESLQLYEWYKLLHIWAQRLLDYSIAYKEIWINDTSSKREILQGIINSNKENVITVLKDYCSNFGFNFNDCLLLYLQTLLKTWCPTITISNTNANKELIISRDEVDGLRNKCNAIVAQMDDKSMLKRFVPVLWEQISFYHYEVFIILMDLIEDKSMDKRNYLCFLQNYTRNGPPTSMEQDEWMHLNPGHNTLPSIAQWRLPFLHKVDIWKIITPELNLRTYEKWLDITPVLKLETHLICTLAIKGEVTRVWGNTSVKSNDTWSLYSKNITLLKEIKKCIQRISDPDGFYYGTAALYYVVNHTPPGADRVAAAKECYEYAQLEANSTKFEEGMLQKIKSKYLRFSSEHILRTHGLDNEKYLALIENPSKLVYELYNDESIPLRYREATRYRPDINAAFNKFCELFSLNVIELRLNLLHEWLQTNARFTELLSQSFTETFVKTSDQNVDRDMEDNLLRTRYMLEYEGMDKFIQVVINIGFGENYGETEYNYNVRYRVLRVLQTVVDTSTLEKLTARDIRTFRKYIKTLEYICKLESIGVCYNIDAFEACSKRELVQILWERQRYSSCVLSIIAQICIEFQICDILFWDKILSQMTKLQMVNDLKKVLLQLQSENVILHDSGYKMSWQLIISEPFREMDINPSSEQINHCVEAICLLYSCPLAHELDFTAIVRNCFQCNQACLAAALLPFLNESETKFVLEIINQKYKIAELLENLNHLSSKGVLTVEQSIDIIKTSAQQKS
ncbi:kinetochore-associated protein 1 isoform X2 [Pseudomyrmex gracilis]|uniref:kinetochore-associated protein 1 isoform X2 n=1 Tax=Pseudomyrmex gracilis TaxID=219809 RepID=UPI000995C19C|nr:kinetochore-associated protein 1 isoform X2 [Pseudomyrmex gracilis]XP_020293995.1 kinetochore-associated protein 1 isoform X2 [Pseudomyrmex gracilis]XP_020293996.1 kinetochore-associated protein 1 isoform X2 [Pseudomyrmex gracilis]XP_020293997.1 kinetochore-associated protein 1 isoform X2 [Pseudomyrmex gracilis]